MLDPFEQKLQLNLPSRRVINRAVDVVINRSAKFRMFVVPTLIQKVKGSSSPSLPYEGNLEVRNYAEKLVYIERIRCDISLFWKY